MPPILTSSQKAASALRRAEKALHNWQDDPNSPRTDVDKMLLILADLRAWVQGHVIAEIEHPQSTTAPSLDQTYLPPSWIPRLPPEDLPLPGTSPAHTIEKSNDEKSNDEKSNDEKYRKKESNDENG